MTFHKTNPPQSDEECRDHKEISLPEQRRTRTPSSSTRRPKPYQYQLLSSDEIMVTARKQYLKILFGGVFMTVLIIFTVFALLWGAFFRTPANNLVGWIVDFDGGIVGKAITRGLTSPNPASKISWTVVSSEQFPDGVLEVSKAVGEYKTWIAVTISPGASDRLSATLTSPNATYDSSEAISAFAVEARNENAFRVMLRPSVRLEIEVLLTLIPLNYQPTSSRHLVVLSGRSSASNNLHPIRITAHPDDERKLKFIPTNENFTPDDRVTGVISISELTPFQSAHASPLCNPCASVVIFTGLIFVMILSFFVVMIANGAREASELCRLLTFRSLIILRISTSGVAYFFVSLFYSLLSLAFELKVDHKFGHSGFLVFWMMNFCGMCAVGLALESMLTLLTATFVPFFLLTWMMVNVAVCVFPIEVLPKFYRYGYAAPFYNISDIARTIVFGVKNQIGFHFSVLIIWGLVSCATLTIFQYWTRRSEISTTQKDMTEKDMI